MDKKSKSTSGKNTERVLNDPKTEASKEVVKPGLSSAQIAKLLAGKAIQAISIPTFNINKGLETVSTSAQAQRFRARRIRESSNLRGLLQTSRADSSNWGRISGFIDAYRKGEYVDAQTPGSRSRQLTALFSGMYTATPQIVEAALEGATREDAEKYQNGQYWPTVVVGSGPSASIFVSQRRESQPQDDILTIDEAPRLGGQFAMAQSPLFRINSRNRPTRQGPAPVLPGDKGNLNSLSPGVIEVSDLDSTVYPTQNVLATACAVNTYLNSSLVANETQLLGVTPNRDLEADGRYRLFTKRNDEVVEVTTDKLIVASGLGREKYKFSDQNTNELIERERAADAPQIFTYDEFLRHFGDRTKQFPLRELTGKTISVIGDGDSAKTVIEVALGLQSRAGDSVAQADAVEKIIWWGQDNTTKEELCDRLRARYSLIGLEAPRQSRSRQDATSRLTAVPVKADIIQESTGSNTGKRFSIVGDRSDRRESSDIIVLAKGYESDIEGVLQGLARPTRISGELINGNIAAQRQLAAELRPGTLITLVEEQGQSFVELIPSSEETVRLRYSLNGTSFDREYESDQKEEAVLQVLSCGRVDTIEAICDVDLTAEGDVSLLDRKATSKQVLDFAQQELDAGKQVILIDNINYYEIGTDLFSPNANPREYFSQYQRLTNGTDFLTGISYGVSRSGAIDLVARFDGSLSDSAILSLPRTRRPTPQDFDDLERYSIQGDVDSLIEYIKPGFGVSYQDRDNGFTYVTCIVISVEGGQVTFIDQDRIGRISDDETFTQILSMDEFIERYLLIDNRQSKIGFNYRLPVGPVENPELLFDETNPYEGGPEYRQNFESVQDFKDYVSAQQQRGATVVVMAYGVESVEVKGQFGVNDTNFVGVSVGSFQEQERAEDSSNYRFDNYVNLDEDRVYDDTSVLVLPPAAKASSKNNNYYARLFSTGAKKDLDDVLVPGFGISYEDDTNSRANEYIISRVGTTITFVDTLGSRQDISVAEYISRIEDSFEYNAYNYDFGVRIPKPTGTSQTPLVALDIPEIQDKENAGRQLTIRAPKLAFTDVKGQLGLGDTAIAKNVFGESVYIIGPPAKLPLSSQEVSRLQPLGIDENTVAIFRYAPRNRALADALPLGRVGITSFEKAPPITVRYGSTAAPPKVLTVESSVLQAHGEKAQLAYNLDLNEAATFALSAALQSKVSSAQPASMTMKAKTIADGKMQLTIASDVMTKSSRKAVMDLLLADSQFMATWARLVQSAPKNGSKEMSFSLTPNGADPYSVTISNSRV